ncbi:MAG: adenylate/guanylate cyclase domain-containing protein [Desulfobacterales bacterium]|nr:adenylate/guanylate cyclase domain-containing protein [Desulfobacterales bacterium]
MLRFSLTRIALSLLIVIFFLLQPAGLCQPTFVERMENLLYDTRLMLTMPGTLEPRIVIVDVDEKSLAKEGRWPWGRDRLALLVDTLFDHYQISILGFDVVFAERDESSGLKVLEQLARNQLRNDRRFLANLEKVRPHLERDRLFAKSLKGRPVILGYYFQPAGAGGEKLGTGVLPAPVVAFADSGAERIPFVLARGYGANLPELQATAIGAGYFDNPLVDADGVYRRVPLVQEYQGRLYESLSLAVARTLLGSPPLELVVASDEGSETILWLEALKVGGLSIPVDDQGAALVPYRGMQGSFPYVSAVDVLRRRADRGVLEGAIVLVGTTAPGLQDLRSTPVQNVYAGVEVHANLISGFLDQTVKHKPSYVAGIEFVTLAFIGLLISFLLPRLSPLWSVAVAGAILVITIKTNLYMWEKGNIVMPLASSVLLTLALFVLHMSYGFFVEARSKRQITKLFGQYVPPELVDEMSKNPADFALDGDSRQMTVLFSDVRGFTTISEGLDPKQLTRLMNEMLTPMTQIIHKHRGTIDKYMGDAIMAFWGAPVTDPEHARHALEAALEMVEALPKLHERFRARGWPPIRTGIGLNTGMMNVGNMGSEFRMAYTVLGDAVNLGSRLEGLTKQFGVFIIVSEFVKEKAPDFAFRELDRVQVKGKDEPVAIFEPLGPSENLDEATLQELTLYHQALKHYREQDWDLAETEFANLQKKAPELLLYKEYLGRISHFRSDPPGKDWDGIYIHETK